LFFGGQPDATAQHQPEPSAPEPDLEPVEPLEQTEEDQQQHQQQQQLLPQAQQQLDPLDPQLLDLQQLLPQQLHQQLFCIVLAEQPPQSPLQLEEQQQQQQEQQDRNLQ
jgi:hypothetical protein